MRALSNAQIAILAASQITAEMRYTDDLTRKADAILAWLNENS